MSKPTRLLYRLAPSRAIGDWTRDPERADAECDPSRGEGDDRGDDRNDRDWRRPFSDADPKQPEDDEDGAGCEQSRCAPRQAAGAPGRDGEEARPEKHGQQADGCDHPRADAANQATVAIAREYDCRVSKQPDDGPEGGDREGGPCQHGVAPCLERAEADERDEGHHGRANEGVRQPRVNRLAPVVDGSGGEHEQPQDTANDRGIPPDAK